MEAASQSTACETLGPPVDCVRDTSDHFACHYSCILYENCSGVQDLWNVGQHDTSQVLARSTGSTRL
eukprot:COSAG05_NODE_2450_length_3052_cov_3.028446_3_plen_67_part_00